jgi:hypothetical protein
MLTIRLVRNGFLWNQVGHKEYGSVLVFSVYRYFQLAVLLSHVMKYMPLRAEG